MSKNLVLNKDSLIKNEEKYNEKTSSLRQRMIELWVRNGKFENALKETEKLLSKHPENAELRYWTGEAYRMISDNPDTIDLAFLEYSKSLNLDSTFAKAYQGLACLYEIKSDTTAAIENYKKYLNFYPDAPDRRFITNKIDKLSKK
jgi:tetratricopeptide (TPR) repeat protein